MTKVFETDEGEHHEKNEIKRKEKCDFCGKIGDLKTEVVNGKLMHLTNEHHHSTDICRDCVVNGVDKEKLQNQLKTKEEIKQELQETEVELV